ncbi:phosphatase PAP2 family protein [Exiguobacterium sp. TDN 0502]|uniref:phosphatase PAP2 family protein n=1 Tax=Exiguobacterium sp. TDN 0502 TaxID=3420731 RepID=UPI003D780C93
MRQPRAAWISASVAMILFVVIAVSIRTTGYFLFDAQLSSYMSKRVPGDYVSWFTQLGSGVGAVTMTALLGGLSYLLWRDRIASIWYVLMAIAVGALNQVVKFAFVRERPSLNELVGGVGYSFPSGHSAMAFAVYAGFLVVAFRHLKRSGKVIVSILTCALFLAMGASRIILNVHYFSDVVGGYSFAAILLFSSYAFIVSHRKKGVA